MSTDSISIISVHSFSSNKENHQEKKCYSKLKDICRAFVFSIGIIAACVLCAIPWTTIPRTDSILYQSMWMEIILPASSFWFLSAGSEFLNLTIWTKERSIKSAKVFFKIFIAHILPYLLVFVSCYIIWSIYFGFNHPMPKLLLIGLPTRFIFLMELWIVLPSEALANDDFRRKLKIYMAYFTWFIIIIAQNEVLSYLFANSPSDLQFLVAFLVAACRELDFYIRSLLLNKMIGNLDESATALLTITVNTLYGVFIAVRLAGSTLATVCCVVAVDFFLHLKNTHQVIKEHKKVAIELIENTSPKKPISTTLIVVTELTEGFIPIIYITCMTLAIHGPNSNILANVGSTYWGEEIESIGPLFYTMIVLFVFDTFSVIVTSFVLWKVTNIDMLQKFCDEINKYWLFFIIKLGLSMSGYFGFTDINFGMDSTGNYLWITPEGRQNLIYNSTELTDEEKWILLANIT